MASHSGVPRQKWWKIRWFAEDDTPEEKRFITKLDCIIVPYLFVTYWVKNLDQNNLSESNTALSSPILPYGKNTPLICSPDNAYVAGMKEELGFYGNELIQLQTMYIIGAVLGQLPFLFLFTYVPMYWLVPGMDVMWGIFTLLQFRANSYAEMAAYRFFVGWFEVPYPGSTYYIID